MLLAVKQLEDNGIIHGHITLDSFFIQNDHLILNDVTPLSDIMTNQQNYVCYRSVEELSGLFTFFSDLRRVGIVLYILIFNKNPYPNEKCVFDEAYGKYSLNLDDLDDDYKEILKMLLNPINITSSLVLEKLVKLKRRKDENSDKYELNERIVNKNLNKQSHSSEMNRLILSSSIVIPPKPVKISSRGKRIGNYVLSDKCIGEGGSGVVYIGELADNNNNDEDKQQYAIKLIDIKEYKDLYLSEAKSLISLSETISQHVIQFIDAFCENDQYVLVTEYCQLGDLRQELDRRIKNNQHFTSEEIVRHFNNLLFGLSELHKLNIIHRDIKPENIFCAVRDNRRRFLYGDFGLCTIKKEEGENREESVFGTYRYVSPEILSEENYNQLADCWSLGCVFYEMCTFQFLYSQFFGLSERNSTRMDSSYPECITKIINGMTQIDINKRMSASDALKLLKESVNHIN